MGEVGEGTVHICINPMASTKVSLPPRLIRTLEIGTSIGLAHQELMTIFVIRQEEPYEGRLSRTVP
jgi:hypothetical protein